MEIKKKTPAKRGRILGLDALRFFAIVLIVIYHCFKDVLPGGFIAVEIFFAVSGFLMGQKLLRMRREEGAKFGGLKSFVKFVWGRLKRFLPTLIFVMVLALSLAYFADPDILTAARPNSLAAATFSTNIMSIINGSTYENSLIPNLFNQTWFLALELQVCIIIYLVVVGFFRLWPVKSGKTLKSYRRLFVLLVVISLVSFGLMTAYGGWFGLFDRAYFGPDSHIGAFFAGAALAVFSAIHRIWPAKKGRRWIYYVFLFLALSGVVAITPFIRYASWDAFVIALPVTAVISILLIFGILKLQKIQVRSRMRVLKVLEYLGSLSFAVYLLHWSLLIVMGDLLKDWPAEGVAALVIIMSLVLAVLIKEVFTPFSKKHRIIFVILLLGSLVLPIMSLIKAPEKSSIEESLNEAKMELEEANQPAKGVTTVAVDYSGVKGLADLLGGDVMKFFDATENFAKPYPVTVRYGGVINMSGRAYYNTPDYGRTSELASKRVMVLGDSVVLGATTALYNTVPGVFVDALGSRNMTDAINLLAGYRAANGGNLPYIIVIGLVTNYVNFGVGTLQAIMEAAGPGHQFVFMTGYCGDYSRDAANNTIRWMANNYGNVHVGDWVSVVVPNVGWYTYADHTHLTPAGRQAYANLVNQVVSGL